MVHLFNANVVYLTMQNNTLAYKWVRIVYRCWKSKTPYDESKYLKALEARNSPLLAASNTC